MFNLTSPKEALSYLGNVFNNIWKGWCLEKSKGPRRNIVHLKVRQSEEQEKAWPERAVFTVEHLIGVSLTAVSYRWHEIGGQISF